MEEAQVRRSPPATPSRPAVDAQPGGWRLHAVPSPVPPRRLAAWERSPWAAAVAAAAVVAVLGLRAPSPQAGLAVVSTTVNHQQSVGPRQAITLSFNQPMDRAGKPDSRCWHAVKIQPATQVTMSLEDARDPGHHPGPPPGGGHRLPGDDPQDLDPEPGRPDPERRRHDRLREPAGIDEVSPSASPAPVLEPAAVGPAAGDGQAFWGPGQRCPRGHRWQRSLAVGAGRRPPRRPPSATRSSSPTPRPPAAATSTPPARLAGQPRLRLPRRGRWSFRVARPRWR